MRGREFGWGQATGRLGACDGRWGVGSDADFYVKVGEGQVGMAGRGGGCVEVKFCIIGIPESILIMRRGWPIGTQDSPEHPDGG